MKRLAICLVLLASMAGSAPMAEAHLMNLFKHEKQKHYPPPPSTAFKFTKTDCGHCTKLVNHLKAKCPCLANHLDGHLKSHLANHGKHGHCNKNGKGNDCCECDNCCECGDCCTCPECQCQ
jgi:hypothetical protein